MHSAILSKVIKLPFVIKIFVLSIFEWPLKTGFTVNKLSCLYIEQRSYLSGPVELDQIYHISIANKSRP